MLGDLLRGVVAQSPVNVSAFRQPWAVKFEAATVAAGHSFGMAAASLQALLNVMRDLEAERMKRARFAEAAWRLGNPGRRPPGSWRTKRLRKKRLKALGCW